MVLKRIKSDLRIFFKRSCQIKKHLTLIEAYKKLKEINYPETAHIYKCEFGDHYHVGNNRKKTQKKVRRALKLKHLTLLERNTYEQKV